MRSIFHAANVRINTRQEMAKRDPTANREPADTALLEVPRTDSASASLPDGWDKFTRHKDGKKYYANRESGKTSWARPQRSKPDSPDSPKRVRRVVW